MLWVPAGLDGVCARSAAVIRGRGEGRACGAVEQGNEMTRCVERRVGPINRSTEQEHQRALSDQAVAYIADALMQLALDFENNHYAEIRRRILLHAGAGRSAARYRGGCPAVA